MGETIHNANNRMPRRHRSGSVWVVLAAVLLAALLAALLVAAMLRMSAPEPGSSVNFSAPVETRKTLPREFIDRNTGSQYVMLEDITDGRTLYAKNADQKCYPASLTKLLTALVAADTCPAETEFTIGTEVRMIDPESSRAHIPVGGRMTLEMLVQAMLLPSGNDAAYATAVGVGRLIAGDPNMSNAAALEAFCRRMNEKAAQLGCTASHFANPDGIHREDHYTTAADMAKIAAAALGQDVIARTVCQPKLTVTLLSGETFTWTNSNRLIQPGGNYSYEGAIGMKTGSTNEAGACLVAAATRDGHTAIVVLMGAREETSRWEDAVGLLDIGFQS